MTANSIVLPGKPGAIAVRTSEALSAPHAETMAMPVYGENDGEN